MDPTRIPELCAGVLGAAALAGLAARPGLHRTAAAAGGARAPGGAAQAVALGLLALALAWPLQLMSPLGLFDDPPALLAALLAAGAALWLGRCWPGLRRAVGWPQALASAVVACAALALLLMPVWHDGLAHGGPRLLAAALALPLALLLVLLLRPEARVAVRVTSALALGAVLTGAAQLAPAAAFVPHRVDLLLLAALLLAALPLQRAPATAAAPPAEADEPLAAPAPVPDAERAHLNRSGFERCLQQAIQDGHGFAVLRIEVEPPPLQGDGAASLTARLFDKAAQRLRSLLRSGDALARLGDRHFLLLGIGVAEQAAVDGLALRALNAVARPVRHGERELAMSAVVGSVTGPGSMDAQRLVGCTEQAARQARRLGQRHRPFAPDDGTEAAADPALLQALREAIAGDGLALQFQPKVDTRSGRVNAVEALLRWEHPQRGRIAPSDFVPLAERHGLIGALGDWAIEAACRQSRAWLDKGLHLRVAVNVSTHQMQQADLVRKIAAALQRHRVAPRLLTCEITESAAMQDTAVTQQIFRELRELGVGVSIDDFGTGYSSLAYLRKLPAEELKIDRAFVTDLEHSADARAVVDAVVRLAHALGLHVVAEGVETEQQRRLLTELGCDQLQGYLLARPMTGEGVLMWALHDRQHDNAFASSLYGDDSPTQPLAR